MSFRGWARREKAHLQSGPLSSRSFLAARRTMNGHVLGVPPLVRPDFSRISRAFATESESERFRRALGVFPPARMPFQAHFGRRSFAAPGVARIHRTSSF
jgi:hypothetical protein